MQDKTNLPHQPSADPVTGPRGPPAAAPAPTTDYYKPKESNLDEVSVEICSFYSNYFFYLIYLFPCTEIRQETICVHVVPSGLRKKFEVHIHIY